MRHACSLESNVQLSPRPVPSRPSRYQEQGLHVEVVKAGGVRRVSVARPLPPLPALHVPLLLPHTLTPHPVSGHRQGHRPAPQSASLGGRRLGAGQCGMGHKCVKRGGYL